MRYISAISFFIVIAFTACKKNDDKINETSVADPEFTSYFQRTTGWTAADGGYSIPLTNDKVLWLWGDSHIGGYDAATNTIPCLFQVNNSGLLQEKNNPSQMSTLTGTGSPASWFVHPGGWPSYLFWPGSGYQSGDTVYVFLTNIKTTPGVGLGFTSGGPNYIGKVKFPEMRVISYHQLQAQNDISFSNGFIKDGEYIYVYGSKGDGFVGTKMYLARIKENNSVNSWEYFNGTNWTTNVNTAAAIASDGNASFSSAFKINNRYVLLSTAFSLGCDGKDIYAATASKPEGPYTAKKSIYQIPDSLNGKFPFFYLAVGHPEFTNDKGVLITYCVNGFFNCGPQTCINNRKDPKWYRPKAFRVPLSMLGAE